MTKLFLALACSTALLAGCDNSRDRAEDKLEADAEASAVAAGPTIAALGLTEMQILNADLLGANGIDLGDVEAVLKGPDGKVDRLLVEVGDSNPDKFVAVPVAGLAVIRQGDDIDLSSEMTRAELMALPAEPIPRP
ncbi:MAG: PRC-barrel domain containing protein [Novosphingobium sp.]